MRAIKLVKKASKKTFKVWGARAKEVLNSAPKAPPIKESLMNWTSSEIKSLAHSKAPVKRG